jgi:hypothetical protein
MNNRIILLALILSVASLMANAQEEFRKPVKHEDKLKEELFELNAYQYNHIFQVAMPDDNFLLADFEKMSYWPDTTVLPAIFDIARTAVENTLDSFTNSITSKRIDVHVPVNNRPLQLRITDHRNADMMVLQYGQQSPLKAGMDTIRILKTMAVKKDKEGVEQRSEVQYTFVLKDLSDIIKLADDKGMIEDISHTLDSVVQYRRNRWAREDTWYHTVGIKYVPGAQGDNEKLIVKKYPGFFKAVDASYYIGASVFRNSVTPYLEIGASYKWKGDVGQYDYVRLSLASIAQFERISTNQYDFYNTTFLGLEIGSLINKVDTWIPLYETSLGMAYMRSDHPSLEPHEGMKLYWHYSLSQAIRFTPEIFVLIRKGTYNYVWPGITVSLKLL